MIYRASISNSHPLWLFTGIQDIIDNCCRWYHQAIALQVRYITEERRTGLYPVSPVRRLPLLLLNKITLPRSEPLFVCLRELPESFFHPSNVWQKKSQPTNLEPAVSLRMINWNCVTFLECQLSPLSTWWMSSNWCSTYFCSRRWFRRKYWVFV